MHPVFDGLRSCNTPTFSSWIMWDADSNVASKLGFQDNPSICRSEMQHSNLEAVVECDWDVKRSIFSLRVVIPARLTRTVVTEKFAMYMLYGNKNDTASFLLKTTTTTFLLETTLSRQRLIF